MKILLINGGKEFGPSGGRLNTTLHEQAREVLTAMGHKIRETVIDRGYDIEEEVEKLLWMDVVIWQMPAWWMAEPWIVKQYVDYVFSRGSGKLYNNDGRHRVTPTEGYGTGGLLQGKKYMISGTWNAPIEAFTRENDFFDRAGIDGVYLHFHKANQFLGMKPLPTFVCMDVVKNPQIEQYLNDYKLHLESIINNE